VDATITSLIYLLGFYWPYFAAALVVGLVVGWFSRARPKA